MTVWLEMDLRLQRRDFDLVVQAEIREPVTGIFGPSGSGKSSLLQSLAGLQRGVRGRIRLGDRVLLDSSKRILVPPHRRCLGFVFQEHHVFPHMSVESNLLYGYRRLAAADRRFELAQIVELLELEELLAQRPQRLSGGERQRVALGRALLASPEALLLDEPLSSLDRQLKGKTLRFMQRVQRELAVPMLWVSHSLVEIRELTEHLLVLERGRCVAHGEYRELLGQPETQVPWHEYGISNLLWAEVVEHEEHSRFTRCRIGGQDLRLPGCHGQVGEQLSLGIDANEVALSLHSLTGTSIQNDLIGPIRSIDVGEERVLVEVEIDSEQGLLVEISHGAREQLDLKLGQQVHCLLKARSLIPRFEDRLD
ncbi:MAG: molybdenum ABC transporter ATP-binding protein [Planctomycetota bacterium]|nr:MAG: molybdenum ABC transporter ATP-binding protein [Planctomycetota bacterium]